jgi:hypothetical protein
MVDAQLVGTYRAEVAELRKQIEGAQVMLADIQNRGSAINRDITAWGDAHKAVVQASQTEDSAAAYTERVGLRLSSIESTLGRVEGTMLLHEKAFRTLGLTLRNTRGGSGRSSRPK